MWIIGPDRLERNPLFGDVYVSVDCSDCSIQLPRPFSRTWYSFTLHGTGLRYEIAVSIEMGLVVWASGQ